MLFIDYVLLLLIVGYNLPNYHAVMLFIDNVLKPPFHCKDEQLTSQMT